MATETPVLEATHREADGSRTARRLRAEGLVPGVVYGGGSDPVSLTVNERALRGVLSVHSALIDLHIDGDKSQPVLIRDQQRHPVTGRIMHIDLIRVDLTKKVQASVPVEVVGAELSPGVRFGGLLEQIIREITVESLPTAIPDSLVIDASQMEIGDSLHISDLVAPEGTEITDEGDIVIATLAASRMAQQVERDEEESETEVVGEEGEAAEAAASDDSSDGDSDGDGA
ncbi:MAG: 50S ribosomal protein L25/general stress protein Ctc [Solirubrobacterales bacterium]|nr:50S ribosomal protein L25/general stress protein Ctc [Solirubrobacterales bacterium]